MGASPCIPLMGRFYLPVKIACLWDITLAWVTSSVVYTIFWGEGIKMEVRAIFLGGGVKWKICQLWGVGAFFWAFRGGGLTLPLWSSQPGSNPLTPCIHHFRIKSITRRLGAFTAKSGRKHYNPPPLTVMWMNFDSPNFPSFCSLSAIISFQTCSNKCILYVLSFHKCIKIKYKMVNMYGVFRD